MTTVSPNALLQHAARCAAAGFTRPLFALSFDCDTPEDAAAAATLFPSLRAQGLPATFAVPGAQLLEHAAVYRALAEQGAAFLNHGARPHAEPAAVLYRGITFYCDLAPEDVVRDIREGDRLVRETLGIVPRGFRAPHFGCYQKPEQLAVLYNTARELGYAFCSTTVPACGLSHGGAFRTDQGLWELPVSGSLADPLLPLDSWNYLANHEDPTLPHYVLKPAYARAFLETADFFLDRELPAVLNVYVDPAHVVAAAPFRQALDGLLARGVEAVDLAELAKRAAGLAG